MTTYSDIETLGGPADSQFTTTRADRLRAVPSSDGNRETATDSELVNRFNTGDESAFEEIIRRYQTKIFSLVQGSIHNHADAEEITQDTFVRVYRNLGGFRGDSSLATWLHRIALNLARKRYWYFFRRRRHATVSFDGPVAGEDTPALSDVLLSAAPDPAHEASREEFINLVAASLEKLAPNYREILALRYTEQHSYDEIAKLTGSNLGTVKSRIARARELLRGEMADGCPEFGRSTPLTHWIEPFRQHPSSVPQLS